MMSIAIIIFPGIQALDVAGPLGVCAEADRFVTREAGYAPVTLGTKSGPFRAANGMRIGSDRIFSDAERRYDMIPFADGPQLPKRPIDPVLREWLAESTP
jgi:transcriptional regulator GlxA family with amidase domain